jgi:hypothetical protein
MKEQDQEGKFEEQLRQNTEGFELRPSDDVWANVKIALVNEKRRRRLGWLKAAAIIVLIGSGIVGWLLVSNNLDESMPAQTTTNSASTVEQKQNDTRLTESSSDPSLGSENSIVAPSYNNASNSSQGVSKKANQKKTGSTGSYQAKEPNPQDVSSNAPVTGAVVLSSENAAINEKEMDELSTSDNENIALKADSDTSVPPALREASVKGNSAASVTSITDPFANAHRFSLGFEIIPMISYRRLSASSEEATLTSSAQKFYDTLVTQLNQYNEPLTSFSIGLVGNYRAWKKWNLGAGVHLTRCGERIGFKAEDPEAYYDSGSGITNGATSNVISSPQPGSDTYVNYHHDWVDIDAHVGYVLLGDEKNELSVWGGPGISVLIPKESQWQNQSSSSAGGGASFSASNAEPSTHENIYKDVAMTAFGGINYQRILSTHFAMSAGLEGHYYLTQIYNTEKGILQVHPYWGGVNVGLAYRF